jgi:GNAT superfamily N-acetyltransferase
VDNTTFDIVRFDAQRLKDVEVLHRAVYGRTPEKALYQKKYDTAYTGQAHLGFIAYAPDGMAAAYYGVIPCFISLEGKLIPAAQSADTMTHPLHRRKGLFALLAQRTYQLCREEGIQLLFGFPNQNSYAGFVNALGWKHTASMSLFIIPAYPSSFFRRLTGRLLRHYLLKKHQLPANGLPNRLADEGFAGVLRDKSYLKYKTYHPTVVVAAGAATAWIKTGDTLFIGDLHAKEAQLEDAITALKKMARQLGIKDISFQVSPGTSLHRMLAERYPSQPSFPLIVMDLARGFPVEKLKFTFADIDIF